VTKRRPPLKPKATVHVRQPAEPPTIGEWLAQQAAERARSQPRENADASRIGRPREERTEPTS
jgi:hypothetical protein